MSPLTIVIRGEHDTGKSTVANLLRMFLEENGFLDVRVSDIEPLPHDQKARFYDRLERNRRRPIRINVELVQSEVGHVCHDPQCAVPTRHGCHDPRCGRQ